jgi:aminoglycoside phosphotransferase (APT) family kinase protein
MQTRKGWIADRVVTRDGRIVPVRATARRPQWADLSVSARDAIAGRLSSDVVRTSSTGTGFTPGFASRLDLADGKRVFVKAASDADDARYGWGLSEAYREEIRKLRGMPSGLPAPALLWTVDDDIADVRWVILCFEYVDGTPPRRPWQPDELRLVTDALAHLAPLVAEAPEGLDLPLFAEQFHEVEAWLARVIERDGSSRWLDEVAALARESSTRCAGTAVVHTDLRDDNILISRDGQVWICDWNWPLRGAPWLDLVTLLLAAAGDGLDADALLVTHPLTREVEPRSIDAWLATIWLYFTTSMEDPVPAHSPYLRDLQAWYGEATEDWLRNRLS